MRKIVTSLCLCLLLALGACSNSEPNSKVVGTEPNSKVVGTYELSSANMIGTEMPIDELIPFLEQKIPSTNFDCLRETSLELKTDYTFETVSDCYFQFETPLTIGNGTYQMNEKSITFTETESETIIEGTIADDYNSFTIEMTEQFGDTPRIVVLTLTKK